MILCVQTRDDDDAKLMVYAIHIIMLVNSAMIYPLKKVDTLGVIICLYNCITLKTEYKKREVRSILMRECGNVKCTSGLVKSSCSSKQAGVA